MTEPWSDAYVERRMREHREWQEREADRMGREILAEIATETTDGGQGPEPERTPVSTEPCSPDPKTSFGKLSSSREAGTMKTQAELEEFAIEHVSGFIDKVYAEAVDMMTRFPAPLDRLIFIEMLRYVLVRDARDTMEIFDIELAEKSKELLIKTIERLDAPKVQ